MARYLEVAAEANTLALKLLELVPIGDKPQAAEMIARLVNYGIRCAPRAVQSTVRYNAVARAVKGLPVKVRMEKREGMYKGRPSSYNALITEPIGGTTTQATVEGASDEAE